jgi:hypothetical protein
MMMLERENRMGKVRALSFLYILIVAPFPILLLTTGRSVIDLKPTYLKRLPIFEKLDGSFTNLNANAIAAPTTSNDIYVRNSQQSFYKKSINHGIFLDTLGTRKHLGSRSFRHSQTIATIVQDIHSTNVVEDGTSTTKSGNWSVSHCCYNFHHGLISYLCLCRFPSTYDSSFSNI